MRFLTTDSQQLVPETPMLSITGNGANLRAAPSASASRLDWFDHGTLVTVLGVRADGWYHVMANDHIGYIAASLLSGTFPYDGTEHKLNEYTASGLVDGDVIEKGTFKPSSVITDVGTRANEIQSVVIKSSTGAAVDNSKYNINYYSGTLTVTKFPLTLTAVSDEKVYDGKALNNKSVKATALANSNHTLSADYEVFDSGDLELCFGSPESALADIEKRTEQILKDGKLPLMIGGEHLVSLGAVRAVKKFYPELHIVHFDAHADLRDDYLGAKLSHACVIRRCHDILGDGRIHQFCIRSGEKTEFEFAREHTEMHRFGFNGLVELVKELRENGTPVYFTIDLDCLDPSVFPGTGTPEAGGVTFMQLLDAIRWVAGTNVVGADVNELAPMLDQSGVSTATACKVLRELLLALCK